VISATASGASASKILERTGEAGALVPKRLYLFGPALDLILVAGGLTFVLLPLCVATPVRLGQTAFLLLNFLCNYPHYMATNYRVYRSRAQIARYKIFAIYITAAFLGIVLLSHLATTATLLTILYTFYFNWSPYHYTGQNYGISIMYLRRGGVDPTPGDRRLLYCACMASFFAYIVYINTTLSSGVIPNAPVAQLGIPEGVARGLFLALAGGAFVSGALFARRMLARAPLRVLAPALLLLVAHTAWFSVTTGVAFFAADLGLGSMRIDNVLAAIAFLHCAQYLGVTAYYAEREQTAEAGRFSFARYYAIVVFGGVLLWLGSSRLLSSVFAADYGLSFLIMLTLINIHHFVMDGAIWKLRDGRIARLLVAPAQAASPPPPETPSGGEPIGWSRPWRIAAWSTLVVLGLGLGGTDIAYRVYIQRAMELASAGQLAAARVLYEKVLRYNGNVGQAIDGMAYDAMSQGDLHLAVERWERSARMNPTSAYPRVGLGELYLRLGRVDDAVAQLETAIVLAPRQPSGFILLSQAYQAKGDQAKAQAMLMRARSITAPRAGSRAGPNY
jgi:tetratricopeptide (TPR) repeat protein